MNDDLVKRLREFEARDCCSQRLDAADRIDELEKALKAVLTHCEYDYPPNAEALKLFVSAALGEKQ